MPLYDTSALTPAGTGDPFLDYQIYCGLDTCITWEVWEALSAQAGNETVYNFTLATQAPALEMMLRGIRVDILARDAAVDHLRNQQARLTHILGRYGEAIWDHPIGPRTTSGAWDLKRLFYEVMRLPEQHTIQKGVRKVSTNREALEKLTVYGTAGAVIRPILLFRDLAKQIEFLTAGVDHDGRIRTSYNVAGPETGRWSSSTNAFGTGTNLQNFPEKLRRVFISDPGRKFAYCDLEGAESWIVAIRAWLVSGDDSYLRVVASGDTHTAVARLVWPELPWTGDLAQDRAIAEQPFYRDESYRQMAKRGGHGTNYYGQPPTMAKHLKLPVQTLERFQDAYFRAFPDIRLWHRWVAQQIQLHGSLTTILGDTRPFMGRVYDDATLREAIAHEPQSVVARVLNLGALRIWRERCLEIRLCAQLHDAILVDFPDEPDREAERAAWIASRLRVPLYQGGQCFAIPNDFSSGWNWGKCSSGNPAGVGKFKGRETRTAPRGGLDRVIPSFHEPD